MDYGPGTSKQSEQKEILGKKASSHINTKEAGDDVEVHLEKRWRVKDDLVGKIHDCIAYKT